MTIALLNKNPGGRDVRRKTRAAGRISIEDHARTHSRVHTREHDCTRETEPPFTPSPPPPRLFFSTFTFLLHESADWFRLNLLRQIFLALLLSFGGGGGGKERNISYRQVCLYHAILMHLRLCITEHVQSSYVQLLQYSGMRYSVL